MKLKYYFLSTRPKVLFIGLGPVLLGICLSLNSAQTTGHKYYFINLTLLLSVLCIQLATHFFNDAYDFLKGADSSQRKGPQRMVQKGLLSIKEVLRAGIICLSVATLAGGFLVFQFGWPALIIGIISLTLAYFYTAGPYPLAYTGFLSDIFVILFFGILAVMGTVYFHTEQWSTEAFIGGLQLGLLALSLLVVNNLRDEQEDRQVSKKTLVVRFGKKFGLVEWSFAQYLPYFIGFYWYVQNQPNMFFLPLILLPLSFYTHFYLLKAFSQIDKFNKVLMLSCVHHFLFTGLLSVSHLLKL